LFIRKIQPQEVYLRFFSVYIEKSPDVEDRGKNLGGKCLNRERIRALFGYLKGYRHLLLISLFIMLSELIFAFISPLFFSVTIDSVLDTKPLDTAPDFIAWLVAAVGGVENIRRNLWIVAVAIVTLQIIRGALTFSRSYSTNKASEGTIKKLRDRLYSHVQNLPFKYHVSAQTGDLLQRATNDLDTIRRFIAGSMLELVRTVMLFVVGIFVMSRIHVPLTFLSLLFSPAIVFTSLYFFRKIQKMFTEVEEADSKVFTLVQENLTGARVVRAFGRQKFELNKFNEGNEELRNEIIKLNNLFSYLWGSLDFISGAQIVIVAVFGIIFTVNGSLTLGQYTAFMSYVHMFIWPLRGFGRVLSDFGRTLIAVSRVQEILNEKEEDFYEGLEPDISGDIVFENVCFSYDDKKVLDNLNMIVKGGQTVAILGGTGSGKSTLIQLLQRLYDIQSGSIKISGVDINDINKKYLRDRIGIVLQEPFLYSRTILENIAIKTDKPDIERVQEASRIASVHDDIERFELGYNTVVGERGVTLSGGQKQRVAIARALVSESDILIFDDSLSAVDTKTDASIREALKSRRQGTTTFIISHRITTLMEADRIFVLKDGRVVEQGTHEELMDIGGIYRKTYEIQSSQVV
jgi:ATP-binding cassette subfamily B protein